MTKRDICYTAVGCSPGWMKGPQWYSLGNIVQKSTDAVMGASGDHFSCPLGMGAIPPFSRASIVCYTAVCCSHGWMKGPH